MTPEQSPAEEPVSFFSLFLLVTLSVSGLLILFFGRVYLGSETFFAHDIQGSDIWHYYFPLKIELSRALGEGRLPMWSSLFSTGLPITAAGEAGVFYLPGLILAYLLPPLSAFHGLVALNFLIGAFWASLYARELGARLNGALLAGLVFGFCGFLLLHVKHFSTSSTTVWVPAVFFALERMRKTGSGLSVALLGFCVATLFFGGYPQVAYYTLLFGGLYAIIIAFTKVGVPTRVQFLMRAGLGVVAGLLLAGIQLLPTLELAENSAREGGLSYDDAFRFGLHPKQLGLFIDPKLFGDPSSLVGDATTGTSGGFRDIIAENNPGPPLRQSLYWEVVPYLGLLPLILSVLGACLIRRARFLVLLCALATLLALGEYGGLSPLLFKLLPGFDRFRFHAHFLIFVSLWIAMLAGLGLSRLSMLRFVQTRPRRIVLTSVAILIWAVDLYIGLGDQNPTISRSKWLAIPESLKTIQSLENELGTDAPFRTISTDILREGFMKSYVEAEGWDGDLDPYLKTLNLIEPNFNVAYGISNLGIYLQLYPQRLAFLVPTAGTFGTPYALRRGENGAVFNLRLLALYNVKYLMSWSELGAPLTKLGDYGGVGLYQNPYCFPRAYWVPHAKRVGGDPETIMRTLCDKLGGLKSAYLDTVFIEDTASSDDSSESEFLDGEDSPKNASEHKDVFDAVTYESANPETVTLRVDAPDDGWVFLSETHYPGWIATVDGEETPIYRANAVGRAVRVPKGKHVIEMNYKPKSLRVGSFMSVGGILLMLFSVMFWRSRRGVSMPFAQMILKGHRGS